MSRESSIKLHPDRRRKHGGYSFLTRGDLPEDRLYIERHLTGVRLGLIRDLGGTEDDLTTAQIVLIDRIVSKLGVIRCIEEYIRENTVMKGDRLSPSLSGSYLAYSNSIRLDLLALGLEKRVGNHSRTTLEVIKEFDAEKERGKAKV